MPLFDLLEDKDTSIGSEIEKRTVSLTNKFFTQNLDPSHKESIEQILYASVHAKLFGISIIELYLSDDGSFAFSFIPREFYTYESNGIYLKRGNTKFIPSEPKYHIIRHKPVLLKTLWIGFAKHFVLSHYMKFTELLGIPPLIANVGSSDSDTMAQVGASLKSITSGSYAVLGKEDTIKVLEGRGSQADFLEFIKYSDTEIAKVISGASLGSNIATSGSFAQSKSHEENRADITAGDVKYATALAKRLFAFLGLNLELNIQIEKDVDLKSRAEMLKILKDLGYDISPHDIAIEFDLPLPKSPSQKPQNEKTLSLNSAVLKDTIQADYETFTPAMRAVEKEIKELLIMTLDNANSFEEAMENLTTIYPHIRMDVLETLMTNTIASNLILGKEIRK